MREDVDVMLTTKARGCLLGGALGDALGAPIEFQNLGRIRAEHGPHGLREMHQAYGRVGAITDDTQMTLFTAEGMIRAMTRLEEKGITTLPGVIHKAYLRWLHTQGRAWSAIEGRVPSHAPDGWLIRERWLHSLRAPGSTCVGALERGEVPAVNTSKGCGGVMRVAPIGIAVRDPAEAFDLGVEVAALTHGHPTGQWPAGVLAALISAVVHQGAGVNDGLEIALGLLVGRPDADETVAAVRAAQALARRGVPTPEQLQELGGAWVAEEALAIALAAALAHPNDVREALILAVNHSGDSDSTGAICGNVLGALHGERALPHDWLDLLEGREVIATLAADLTTQFESGSPREPNGDIARSWWERYPGW